MIDLLTPARIAVREPARSKKRALEIVARLLATDQPDLNERSIFSSLCAREKLGSTGFGKGVALPHGRLQDSDTVSGAFVLLKEPVEFEATDQQPVDLLFALVVPSHCEERHLELLAQLADLFNDPARREALRAADDAQAVLQLLEDWQTERVLG
ncbi:MAG: PTS IIA-like nitrogen regulatory protein PtsN [Xanthomonadales bacterium]|nr:PTS IIA-like nitrogen regulatory protein PtsN [Xanthomonadales bacterium]